MSDPRPTLHGISSCDACRKAQKWLDARGIGYRTHDLRTDGLTLPMLERWSRRLDWQQLLNTRSITWRKLPDVDRVDLTRDRAIALMLEHPTLVKRPVLEHRDFISTGFSPDRYGELLARG